MAHIDLPLYNKCNNCCLMCTNPTDFFSETNFSYYLQKNFLERLKKINPKDLNEISLTGGEPTLHPDFFEILDFIKKHFPKSNITLLTNGRRFYYINFAKNLWRHKNISIAVSLLGHNAITHDAITGTKGSFKQTISGLKNLIFTKIDKSQKIEIRVIACRLNLRFIPKIIKFLKDKFLIVDRVVLIFMEYEGQAIVNKKQVAITYKDIFPVLNQIKKDILAFREFRLYHFPLCVLEPYFWPYVWRTLPAEEISFLPECRKCALKKHCLGIHKGYLKYVKKPEIQPWLSLEGIKIEETGNFYKPINSVYEKN